MMSSESSPIVFELSAREKLLWSGQPKQGLVLRPSDAFLIPFSLLWGGFALFWETGVIASGAPFFFMLWGIPFVLMGAYITVGRFFVDAYIRSKTYYGLTNERAIIITGLLCRQLKSINLRTTSDIALTQQGDEHGTITFGSGPPYAAWSRGLAWPGTNQVLPPEFELIPKAKMVYAAIRQVQHETAV